MGHIKLTILSKVSFLIQAIGNVWPWIAGVGLILAMIQTIAGCIVRVYFVYWARGIGVWLIPAALGMAFTMLAIPWKALQTIWRDLSNNPGPDVSHETKEERAHHLRQPSLRSRGHGQLYTRAAWVEGEGQGEQELPSKKMVVGVQFAGLNQFF